MANPYIDIRDYSATGNAVSAGNGAITGGTTLTAVDTVFPTSGSVRISDSAGNHHRTTFSGGGSDTITLASGWPYGIVANLCFSAGADDTSAIDSALAAAKTAKLQLFIPPGYRCYYNDDTLLLADADTGFKGITGGGGIVATECQISRVKNINIDGFVCNNLHLSGIWQSSIRHLTCHLLKIDGYNNVWGTFWNSFESLQTQGIRIDCATSSTNQNSFNSVTAFGNNCNKGGLHITGTSSSDSMEATNNVFYNIDTSYSNIDGYGAQILNDSYRNQTNIIQGWYGEHSSGTSPSLYLYIKGNWNVMGAALDIDGRQLKLSNRNHYLFSVNQIERNNGDFFAAGINNCAVGGEWDVLDDDTWSHPACLQYFGTWVNSSTPYNPDTCPSGIRKQVTKDTNGTNSEYIRINLNFAETKEIACCIWFKSNVSDTDDGEYTFHIIANESLSTYASPEGVFVHSSGWKLMRFTIKAQDYIDLYLPATRYRTIGINSIFITDQKTAFLPTKKDRTYIRGTGSIPAGLSFTIPVPSGTQYQSRQRGFAKVYLDAEAASPTYEGITGSAYITFAKARYNSITDALILNVQSAIAGVNGGSTSFVFTGTQDGIEIEAPTGIETVTIRYELEIDV